MCCVCVEPCVCGVCGMCVCVCVCVCCVFVCERVMCGESVHTLWGCVHVVCVCGVCGVCV